MLKGYMAEKRSQQSEAYKLATGTRKRTFQVYNKPVCGEPREKRGWYFCVEGVSYSDVHVTV